MHELLQWLITKRKNYRRRRMNKILTNFYRELGAWIREIYEDIHYDTYKCICGKNFRYRGHCSVGDNEKCEFFMLIESEDFLNIIYPNMSQEYPYGISILFKNINISIFIGNTTFYNYLNSDREVLKHMCEGILLHEVGHAIQHDRDEEVDPNINILVSLNHETQADIYSMSINPIGMQLYLSLLYCHLRDLPTYLHDEIPDRLYRLLEFKYKGYKPIVNKYMSGLDYTYSYDYIHQYITVFDNELDQ